MKEIDQIRKAADLVEIVREHTKLKKRGNKMVGDCPLCKAKNKFTVDKEKQLFHCFGCGDGGDLFTFVMKKLNMAFPEALEWLIGKCKLGNVKFDYLLSNMLFFQKELRNCFDDWMSDKMKDKQFIFKMNWLIRELKRIDEYDDLPFPF